MLYLSLALLRDRKKKKSNIKFLLHKEYSFITYYLMVVYRSGTGIIDAASIGAVSAISLVAYILASVIAFISLLKFVNSSLQWFGDRVGLTPPDYPPLTFEVRFHLRIKTLDTQRCYNCLLCVF